MRVWSERRAGERLRIRLRERRIELVHENWKQLLEIAAGFLSTSVIAIGLVAWLSGRSWGIFMAGFWLGGLAVFAYIILTFIDGEASRLSAGLDAEQNTAHELRRLRRDGWKIVHNLHFQGGDVDHVAIGPGGVVVLETKSSSADWGYLSREGIVERWARQAEQGAFRVHHLARTRAEVDVEVLPVVVTWISGQTSDTWSIGTVVGTRGGFVADYLRGLPVLLDADTVDRVHQALSRAGQQFDASVGIDQRRVRLGLLQRQA